MPISTKLAILNKVYYSDVGIFGAFENMRDMKYMRDICDMLYGGTCFCILLIYSIYRAKYNKYQV